MHEPLWWFYLAEREPLAAVLAPMLEKCLQRKWRVLVVGPPDRIETLDAELWTWRDDSFLPHGTDQADRQPVLLSSECVAHNRAEALVLLDMGVLPDTSFARIIVLTSREDRPAVSAMAGRFAELPVEDRRCFVQSAGSWHAAEAIPLEE